MRDHSPIKIEEFNGLFQRGDATSCPIDHFSDCNNIQFSQNSFYSRDGIEPFLPYKSIRRIHNYISSAGESLLVLDRFGNLFHSDSPTPFTYILSISTMSDFSVVSINGLAYITPHDGELGLANQFVYVYRGDGVPARKIAGAAPVNGKTIQPFFAINSLTESGFISEGFRIFTVVYGNAANEWSLMSTTQFATIFSPDGSSVLLKNLPISPSGAVTQRLIAVTDPITDPYNGNPTFYPYKKLLIINDNILTEKLVSYNESDLTSLPSLGSGASPPAAPTDNNAFRASNSVNDGDADLGLVFVAVSYETNTGFTTPGGPEIFAAVNRSGNKKLLIQNIPLSPDSFVTARRLLMTRTVTTLQDDPENYTWYFVPNGRIGDNSTTEYEIEAFDVNLLSDASYLFEILSEVPAKVNLAIYHNRLIGINNSDLAIVSNVSDLESFNSVDGFLSFPDDGKYLTTGQEYRDIFHLFRQKKVLGFTDNGDVPSSWNYVEIDSGIGSFVHGISVIKTGDKINIEFLMIANRDGFFTFTGLFNKPELSWKIRDYWLANVTNASSVNHTNYQTIFIVLANGTMLIADYSNGMDAKNIRWSPWSFAQLVKSVAIYNETDLLLGIGSNA